MGSAVQQRGRFADAQESLIQVAKRSNGFSAVMKDFDFLILRNRVFKLFNFQICVVPSSKVVDLLIFRKSVFKLQNVQI